MRQIFLCMPNLLFWFNMVEQCLVHKNSAADNKWWLVRQFELVKCLHKAVGKSLGVTQCDQWSRLMGVETNKGQVILRGCCYCSLTERQFPNLMFCAMNFIIYIHSHVISLQEFIWSACTHISHLIILPPLLSPIMKYWLTFWKVCRAMHF